MIKFDFHIKIIINLIKIHNLKVFCDLTVNLIESIFVRFNKLDVVDIKNQIDFLFKMHLQISILLIKDEI